MAETDDDTQAAQSTLDDLKRRASEATAGVTTQPFGGQTRRMTGTDTVDPRSAFPSEAAAELMKARRAETERMSGVIDQFSAATRAAARPIGAPPDLKQQDLPKAPPQMPYTDAMQVFQNPGVLIATLGSLFTRTPAIHALNAGAAAIEGFRTGQTEAYELARQQWKDKTEEIKARNSMELDKYNAAWRKTEHSVAERQAQLTALAAEFKHEAMKNALATGDMETVYNLIQLQQTANVQLDNSLEKAREADMRIAEAREARQQRRDIHIEDLDAKERMFNVSQEDKRRFHDERLRLEEEKLTEQARRTDLNAEQKRDAQDALNRFRESTLEERARRTDLTHSDRRAALEALDTFRMKQLEERARATDLNIDQRREAQRSLESYRTKTLEQRLDMFNRGLEQKQKVQAETLELKRAQVSNQAWPPMSDEGLRFMVDQYLAGDRSVLQNIGRGRQGPQNVQRFRELIPQVARENNMTPQDVARRLQEYAATTGALRSFETRGANIELAANAAKTTLKLAKEASDAVVRSNLVPYNMLSQAVRTGTSDPRMKQFVDANQAAISEYAAVIGRGNPTITVHAQGRAELLLDTRDGPRAYNAGLAQLNKEIEAVRAAREETRDYVTRKIIEQSPKAGVPMPAINDTPGVIRYDAEGNRVQQ